MEKVLFSEVKNRISTGDALFWSVDFKPRFGSLTYSIIKLYQKLFNKKVSHVGIAINLLDIPMVIDAVPPAIRLFPLKLEDDFYWFELNLNLKGYDKIYINYLLDYVGRKYRVFDLIKNLLGIKSENSYYCSEFASDFYNNVGLIKNRSAGLTPATLYEELVRVTGKEPYLVHIDRVNL